MAIPYDKEIEKLIREFSRKYGVDEEAALAVASVEGGVAKGAAGDGGTSFGPFQLHRGGAMPADKPAEWASTPDGIEYAIRLMAQDGARGLTGKAAVEAIVRKFERPKYPGPEVEKAWSNYGKIGSPSDLPAGGVATVPTPVPRKGQGGGSGVRIKLDPPAMHSLALLLEQWRSTYAELAPRLDGGLAPAMPAHVAGQVHEVLAAGRATLAEIATAFDADAVDLNRRARLADPTTPPLHGRRGVGFRFFDNAAAIVKRGSKNRAVVEALQRRLVNAGLGPLAVDGIFGPATLAALIAFQKRVGYAVTGVLDKHTWYALVRADQKPHVVPQQPGAAAGPTTASRERAAIVDFALAAVKDGVPPYVFGGGRPPSKYTSPGRFPPTDCSGFVTLAYQWATNGKVDPNDRTFSGAYAGWILTSGNGSTIPLGAAKAGDLVCYGSGHVAMLVKPIGGGDWMIVSHGGPDGQPPRELKLSDESAWFRQHEGVGPTYRSFLP